jgi:hypothetical protein
MADTDEVRINGKLFSWTSVIFKIDGVRVYGVTAIEWSQKRERVKSRGQNKAGRPRGRTGGLYTPENLKTTFHKDTAAAQRKSLAQKAGSDSYGDAEVPIYLQYVEGTKTTTVEFEECTVAGDGGKSEESAEPDKEDWEWDTMGIKVDGKTLYANEAR